MAQPQKNTDVHKGMILWEGFPRQTCKNYLRRKQGCKLMGQIWTVQQFVCASLGRSLCHGNEHHGIIPGHHDCSTKAVFLCTAVKLQCWPMLARNGPYWRRLAFSFLHVSFIGTIASVVLSSSFIFKIALGLALGESWLLLAQPQKNTDVHKGMLLWKGFPRQTCKNDLRQKQGCKLMSQIWTVQQFVCASLGRSLCHGNEHHGIDTNIQTCSVQAIMTVPQRLPFSAQLSNCNVGPRWHVMAHIGACWHSVFSTFHSLGQ